MKNSKRTWLVSLTAAGSLFLGSLVTAQETGNSASSQSAPIAVPTNSAAAEQNLAAVVDADTNVSAAASTNAPATQEKEQNWIRPQQIVLMGQNVELNAGETAEEVVVIGGSAKIHGQVRRAAVVIWGNLEVDGEVGDAAVAVMGNVKIGPGALVHKDAVVVMGSLTIAEGARVEHDVVSVAGKLDIAKGAVVKGAKVNVGTPVHFPRLEWLGKWLRYCVFELRPLAPQVGWVWAVAGVFFLLYLFVAAVFPRPIQVCVEALTKRPVTTFLMGLLTELLAPVVILILIATGIGLLVVPFVWMALFLAAIVGKVAIREWLGLQIGRHFGGGFQHPLVAFLIGTIIITLLYLVPILGLVTFLIVSVWGLGCAVTAAFGSLRREMPEKSAPPQPSSTPPAAMAAAAPMQMAVALGVSPGFAPAGTSSSGTPESLSPPGAPAPGGASQTQPAVAAPPATPPVYPSALNFPRAGFWERMGAAFLDIVIVGILAGIVGGPLGFLVGILGSPSVGLMIALAYFSGLWAWKGTTIGGIVLKLQVVRSDGSPLTFLVALVRGLTAALSVVVFFLGFLWIAWDNDKQGWHDKIAGTEVIRLPRSVPLVCV